MKIQSYSDIITNSSSELFVFNNRDSIESVIGNLNNICPDWVDEYCKPEKMADTDLGRISRLIYYMLGFENKYAEEAYYCKKHGIPESIDEDGNRYYDVILKPADFDKTDSAATNLAHTMGVEPEDIFSNWNEYNPFSNIWDDEMEYSDFLEVNERGIMLYKETFPDKILLQSKDDTPNFDNLEKIEKIADERYHLG